MKKILLMIIMGLPLIVLSQTPVPGGPVSGTWDLAGSPYMVNGEIHIPETATLQIEAGVEVRFTGWYKLNVFGSLMAEGSQVNQILFTANDPASHWHGIRFIENEATSVLDYCIVQYGQTVLNNNMLQFPDNAGGGIMIHKSLDADITISNSIIQYNEAWWGGGIDMWESRVTIDNCDIVNNDAEIGGGVDLINYSEATITGCNIADNQANIQAGGITIQVQCQLEMSESTISNNYSNGKGGGILSSNGCTLNLNNNTISYNSSGTGGGGLYIESPSANGLILESNLIVKNSATYGGGIFIEDCQSYATFSDNTIVFNSAQINGGGLSVNGDSDPMISSNILYFNDVAGVIHQIVITSVNSTPLFSYCDIQGGEDGITGIGDPGGYDYCIDEDPLFVNSMNDDYNLSWTDYPDTNSTMSPCIDKGCPAPLPGPDGTCNDIGVYEYFQVLDVPEAIPPISYSQTSFLAFWTEAYGALWYELDVAEDTYFNTLVYNSIIVNGTDYLVEGLDFNTEYYYRVRSANAALLSGNSNTMGNDIIIRTRENFLSEPLIYSMNGKVKVEISDKDHNPIDLQIYDLSGRLIQNHRIQSGSNTINLNLSNQIIIIKVLIEGKAYQQKLFIP